jgi:hypothetical protein
MVEPQDVFRIEQGVCRAHPFVADLLTFYAVTLAGMAREMGFPRVEAPATITMACLAANMDIVVPLAEFQRASISGEMPLLIVVQALEKRPAPEGKTARGMKSLSARIGCALFALFAELAVNWHRSISTDYPNWPPVLNFARVVRNAIAHNGTINITDPAAAVVSWRRLTYSYKDFGRDIINRDISYGDLLVLMLDMETELNSLGAPFDLLTP